MRKITTVKKMVGIIAICCSLVLSNPAKAFIWPCIDISQISAFVSSITKGISTITNAKSQLDNMMNTIKVIGDQITTMKKYMADLRDTITKLKETIEGAVSSIKEAVNEIQTVVDDIKTKADEILNKEKQDASSTVDSINQGAISGYSSTDLQDIINTARQQSEKNREAINMLYDEALDNINETLDNANTSIDMIVEAVNTNKDLSDDDKNKLKETADDIKNDISKIKESANKAINQAKENLNSQYAGDISNAYDEYSKAIDDYALGKITIEELNKAGETFKETINSLDSGLTQSLIDDFSAQVNNVVQKIEDLKEEMLDSVSNSKDYSDEDEESAEESTPETQERATPTNNITTLPSRQRNIKLIVRDKFTFKFINQKNNVLAAAVYKEDVRGEPFLISQELMCNNKDESDIENLSNPSWLRVCLSDAKIEEDIHKTPNGKPLYAPYLKDGVYNHILQDYNAANIVTISRAKQFASSFRGDTGNEDQSEFHSLKGMIGTGDVDNTLQGLTALSTIELWTPRIWSMIRQVEAVNRAKNMMKIFNIEEDLHLDVRNNENEEVKKAMNSNKGSIGNNSKIFPNVMLYQCDRVERGIDASAISIEKGKTIGDQEEKIRECLLMYASGASRGYIKGESKEDASDSSKKMWRDKQKMALSDAVFENFVMAVSANYNSTRDYIRADSLGNGNVNIVSLQDGIKQISQARDGYAAGAQINYYGTQQMLNIVDSDALDLQTEILKDLQNIDFSFFPDQE